MKTWLMWNLFKRTRFFIYQGPYEETWAGYSEYSIYDKVWSGWTKTPFVKTEENLDLIFERFQDDRAPRRYKGRSLAIGDVIVLDRHAWVICHEAWGYVIVLTFNKQQARNRESPMEARLKQRMKKEASPT